MDAIVSIVAEVLLLGSIALLIWGGILTLGQLFRTAHERDASNAVRRPGRRTQRAALASERRRRFSRLSPPA